MEERDQYWQQVLQEKEKTQTELVSSKVSWEIGLNPMISQNPSTILFYSFNIYPSGAKYLWCHMNLADVILPVLIKVISLLVFFLWKTFKLGCNWCLDVKQNDVTILAMSECLYSVLTCYRICKKPHAGIKTHQQDLYHFSW